MFRDECMTCRVCDTPFEEHYYETQIINLCWEHDYEEEVYYYYYLKFIRQDEIFIEAGLPELVSSIFSLQELNEAWACEQTIRNLRGSKSRGQISLCVKLF